MKGRRIWLGALACVFLLAGCGQRTDSGADGTKYVGVVVDRYAGEGRAEADCLAVDAGEEGVVVFSIVDSTQISGAEEIAVGDTVEIQCESGTDGDSRPIVSVTVQSAVLQEPPALAVLCGESRAEALKGSYSWTLVEKNGTAASTIADGAHPLQCKEYMQPLLFASEASVSALTARLQFEAAPDAVEVHCWDGDAWEQYDAESTDVTVKGGLTEGYSVDLRNGNFIYEVVAEWNRSEQYSGTAHYSFYTERTEAAAE